MFFTNQIKQFRAKRNSYWASFMDKVTSWTNFVFYQYILLRFLGMPLILTLVTILMDQFGSKESHILPNMGTYTCMLGSEFEPYSSFMKTSKFLYFYLILLILTLVNIICFIITAYHFISHWLSSQSMFGRYFIVQNQEGVTKQIQPFSQADSPWSQIKLVAKLFFIMGK